MKSAAGMQLQWVSWGREREMGLEVGRGRSRANDEGRGQVGTTDLGQVAGF